LPRTEVEGAGTFDVEEGKRLVLAIKEDAGVDILHGCRSMTTKSTAVSASKPCSLGTVVGWS
jgi:hypothetical protein